MDLARALRKKDTNRTRRIPAGASIMITLYGAYRSRASRPLWLLAETGTPFTHLLVIQAYCLADPAALDAPLNTTSASFLR